MLNYRLTSWIENNSILCDEQDGFRKNRSTMDHISNLVYVDLLETRIKKKRDTFAAFIDFSKAYDRVDRTLLWGKLIKLGISGRMLKALKSLYNEVKCAVRINGQISDWFDVKIGLKQGCILSPLLFNIFINDLAQTVNNLECGASYGEGDVSILLYADDIVLCQIMKPNYRVCYAASMIIVCHGA